MDFSLTEEQKMVQQMVRDFATREIAPTVADHDRRQEPDRALLRKLGAQGILGLCIPVRYGGSGTDYVSLGLACEELERADTSARVILSVHVGLNSMALLQWATEEQKERFLAPQARGDKIAAFGLTEPGAGSDVASLSATARREGDTYILNGEKMWISLATLADHVLVVARTDATAGVRGMTAFIVEQQMPGVTSGSIHGKLGVRAGDTGWMAMQDTPVSLSHRLGEEGEGFKIAMSCLDNGRYTIASGATGLIRGCLEESVAYARDRETFGVPIGQHQLIQQMLAQMARDYEAARLLYLQVGWLKNQGIRNTRQVSLAKWFATEASYRAATDAVQIHGAYGFSDEYPVERYLRNSKGAIIYEGSSQVHELMQGQYAMGYRTDRPLRCELPPYDPDEWQVEP
jgi:alkylation response protein AidB-like acyl-CoA dehydrogenase